MVAKKTNHFVIANLSRGLNGELKPFFTKFIRLLVSELTNELERLQMIAKSIA